MRIPRGVGGVHAAVFTVQGTVIGGQLPLNAVHVAVYMGQTMENSVQMTVHTIHATLEHVHATVNTIQPMLFDVQSMLRTVQTIYNSGQAT